MVDIQTGKESESRTTLSDELKRLYETAGSGSFTNEHEWCYQRGEGEEKELVNISFAFDVDGEIQTVRLNGDAIRRDQLDLMATEGYLHGLVYDITRMLDDTRRHDMRTKRQ